MKKFISYIFAFTAFAFALTAFATAFSGCSKDILNEPVWDGEGAVLSLELSAGESTVVSKASAYGEDKWNENVIKGFRLYFFNAETSSDDVPAAYVWPENGWAEITNSGAVVSEGTVSGEAPSEGKVSVKFTMKKKTVSALFTTLSSCRVYAVANIDGFGELPSSENPTLGELKNTVIKTSFGPNLSEDPYSAAPESFPMTGEGTVAKDDAARKLTAGEIQMKRAASKISFYVTKVDNSDIDDKNWTPDTENMRVSYINGIDRGYLDANMGWSDRSAGLFSYKGKSRKLSACTAEDGTAAGWWCEMPFWSLYNDWSSSSESEAPYLMLSVPWKYASTDDSGNTSTRYFTCYYAVPFNSISKCLERNAWYKVSLSVSILGSGDPDNPTVIAPSYMILPWGNETVKTNAELLRYRYLMVDENSYVMNNVNSLSIPYYTSHPVSVVSSSMTRTVLAPSSGYKPYEESVSSSAYTLTPNADNSAVVFTHNLENDYDEDYDVTAYTLTFTIRHTDEPNFTETITVTQYPALYVVAELNSDCSTSNIDAGTTGRNNYSHYGYIYVNGGQRNSQNWTYARGAGNNTDPYMYVVTVSSLPSGSPYIIGDPRTETVSVPTLSSSGDWGGFFPGGSSGTSSWASAPDMDNKTRQISYYYPTDTDGSRVNNMIAPSFRIASSYGVAYSYSYADAKKRCASYQEDGYPAGRWRIPTKAEIEYMVMLADDGKIPELLTESSYYWGSNNTAYRPNGATSTSNSYIRCVYDEWYWTDKCTKSTFTWGDLER